MRIGVLDSYEERKMGLRNNYMSILIGKGLSEDWSRQSRF